LNAKSSNIPAIWVGRFAEFTGHIGYRFALAEPAEIPSSARRGSNATITLTWTNRGNAPLYRPYRVAMRLIRGGVEIARDLSDVDVRTWMPFSADGVNYPMTFLLAIPPDSTAGTAVVQVSMLDPAAGAPAVRFDMAGGNPDLWYEVGMMTVE
jgi:hypothetical protein